jgi:hypothetical protein
MKAADFGGQSDTTLPGSIQPGIHPPSLLPRTCPFPRKEALAYAGVIKKAQIGEGCLALLLRLQPPGNTCVILACHSNDWCPDLEQRVADQGTAHHAAQMLEHQLVVMCLGT